MSTHDPNTHDPNTLGDLPPHPVDPLLDEAVAAEARHDSVDPERFLGRLRSRLVPVSPQARLRPVLALAAVVPLVLTLWLILRSDAPSTRSNEELALIENLDLLVLLEDLTPEEIEELDPELLDLYLDWEIVDELPVELLENS